MNTHVQRRTERPAAAMLTGQVLCMLGMATYAVLLPLLQKEWALSNAQSGLIGSGFFLGYISTVTLWSTLTDRMDGVLVVMTRTHDIASKPVSM